MSHRRGVTPFVLFWNLSGNISTKSGKMSVLMISEWMAATPLTALDPMTDKKAMLTRLGRERGHVGLVMVEAK